MISAARPGGRASERSWGPKSSRPLPSEARGPAGSRCGRGIRRRQARLSEGFRKARIQGLDAEGTAGITNWCNEVGVFPTRNFQTSYADHYTRINGKAVLERLKITDKGCYCCHSPAANTAIPKPGWVRPMSKGRNMKPSPFSAATACCRASKKWRMPTTCAMSSASTPFRPER